MFFHIRMFNIEYNMKQKRKTVYFWNLLSIESLYVIHRWFLLVVKAVGSQDPLQFTVKELSYTWKVCDSVKNPLSERLFLI